jgi:hypothetical protein
MATIISQIILDGKRMMEKHGKKLQITLVTDHGNRRGVDHFVKMICWSSVDDKGKHILRHFNLDIDKGGHTTVEAANAIYKSLKALHIDGVEDVEFSFICGDSGGGAKVQLMHPRLVEIGMMADLSDYVNCILQAFNLLYEHACKDILGDQGLGRNTVFQMIYLAILLIKTIKQQTNIETLKKIYATSMMQAMTDDRYIAGAKKNFIQAFDELLDDIDVEESENGAWDNEADNDTNVSINAGTNSTNDTADSTDNTDSTESSTDLPDASKLQQLAEKLSSKCPTNQADPNFGRWGTISAAAHTVLEHYVPLFYMAQNTAIIEKNNSYLHKIYALHLLIL